MHILGHLLAENQPVRVALTYFYGIGPKIAQRLCARTSIHNRCRVRDLTPVQVHALTSYLSSPSTFAIAPRNPLASPDFLVPAMNAPPLPVAQPKRQHQDKKDKDPLRMVKIETDLRREIRENIAHQRMIGSYVGRRHAMHLPVRGQNTQSNAKTAKRLNRVERWN